MIRISDISIKGFLESIGMILLLLIIIPILLVVAPFILSIVLIQDLSDQYKLRQFIQRNRGKVFLYLTDGNRQQDFCRHNRIPLEKLAEVVTYDNHNLMYDNFNLGTIIDRDKGFPQLILIEKSKPKVVILKDDYRQLKGKKYAVDDFLTKIRVETNEWQFMA